MSGYEPEPARHVLERLPERGRLLHPGALAPARPEGHQPGGDGGALEDGQHPRTEGVVTRHQSQSNNSS